MKKITAVLNVDDVEASADFWKERFGFEAVAEVPGDAGLVFSLLQRGGVEVMVQSWTSIDEDPTDIHRPEVPSPTFLFIEVEDLDAILPKLDGVPVLAEPHETFYGMREVTVREPGGHIVTFAQPVG